MELEFELDEVEYGNDYFSAVLVVEGSIETDVLDGEAWGRPFHHETKGFVVEDATLFIYDHDGGELAHLEDVDYSEYITEDELQSKALD